MHLGLLDLDLLITVQDNGVLSVLPRQSSAILFSTSPRQQATWRELLTHLMALDLTQEGLSILQMEGNQSSSSR